MLLEKLAFLLVVGVVYGEGSVGNSSAEEASSKPWMNVRLPSNLVPIEYEVDLRPILEENENGMYIFIGSSAVIFRCEEPTKFIIVHSRKLNYTKDQMTLQNENRSEIAIVDLFFYEDNDYAVIVMAYSCIQSTTYKLSINEFIGELGADLNGFYRSEYTSSNGERRIIATTQMQPTGTRETFPCFEEPALKANYTVTLWYKANTGYFALSNMLPASYSEKVIDDDLWKSTTFHKSVRMSAYLLAFVVCDFSYVETFTKSGVQTRIYSRNETIENGEAQYAQDIVPKLLDYFESYFAVPYPLQKSDQIALSDFGAGAMENWGLIVYRESFILFDKDRSSILDKASLTYVVSHELAHMWFGNLVSPAWWDDIWLNEGFATYMGYLGMAKVRPKWQSKNVFHVKEFQKALKADSLTSSRPLVQPVNSPAEIMAQFDVMSYSKGSSIVRMTNAFMGEKNLVAGLTKYLTTLSYESATHKDLFQHWEDQANLVGLKLPARLTTILETWTLQMGYPLVSVRKEPGTHNYTVTQEYFLLNPSATPVQTPGSEKYGYKWYVPFTFKTHTNLKAKKVVRRWLDAKEPELTIHEEDYILANIDALGYYRVNYDDATWLKLTEILKSVNFKHISIRNRAQLIDDAFTVSSTGKLDTTIAMELSLYLKNEKEYVPWQSFFGSIQFLDEVLGRSSLYGMFSEYVNNLISPVIYNQNTWKDFNKGDSVLLKRMTKRIAIEAACHYGNHHCISRARRLFAKWKKNPDNTRIISATYRRFVYCTAIRYGNVKDWDFAWDQFQATDNAQIQDDLRYGLSCSREPWVLTRYIGYCLNPTMVRSSNAVQGCLFYIASHEYGRDAVWAFISNNWDSLLKLASGNPDFPAIVKISTARFSTDHELNMIMVFKDAHEDLGSAARAVDQAIEETKFNINWRQLNEEKFGRWLHGHGG